MAAFLALREVEIDPLEDIHLFGAVPKDLKIC